MSRFLKYSYSLVLCLLALACTQVQQEKKPVEIPFTQDDLTQIYSLAFDSLLGPADQHWLTEEETSSVDTLIIHLNYKLDHLSEEFNKSILSENRYYGRGRNMLEKYYGFEKEAFDSILADSTWTFYNYKAPGIIASNFNYKSILDARSQEAYYAVDTLGEVTLYKIAFNHDANYVIVTAGLYIGPEHGSGYAYFFRKEDGKWKVVGKTRLYIS